MAGLTTANQLVKEASNECFDLVVVEARNHICGQIFTLEFRGEKVEFGATWIHEIEASPSINISSRLGLWKARSPRNAWRYFLKITSSKQRVGSSLILP